MNAKRDQAILFAHRKRMSLSAIGREHGISRERVRQIVWELEHKDEAELSARVRNAIRSEGCPLTPAEVAGRYTLQELKRIPNLGAGSINELNEWLTRHGEKPIT